jgi:hypothetical protein
MLSHRDSEVGLYRSFIVEFYKMSAYGACAIQFTMAGRPPRLGDAKSRPKSRPRYVPQDGWGSLVYGRRAYATDRQRA